MPQAYNTRGTRISMMSAAAVPVNSLITAISSTTPTVLTVTGYAGAVGDIVYVKDTGVAALDGKQFVVSVIGAGTITLAGSDTSFYSAPITVPLVASVDSYVILTDTTVTCFSEISLSKEAVPQLDVGTFCSPAAKISGIATSGGTVSFSGFVDATDAGYLALLAAENDQLTKLWQIQLPNSQGYLLFEGSVAVVTQAITIDSAIAFSGTINLATIARHAIV